ncbi:unnamed protein product [Ostreobium quekettii]|uniref:FAD-binding FR-type domain-containing protein n=1 Tax=Ostreobium quekettii TaxID=121088 RepID=A0A8S1J8E9_9CHLO|nr:unnamed protein product [Ostreobium quekettii]
MYQQTKDVRILCAELLPGKVLSLMMTKPKGFEYESGMYLYVNCPSISQWEWHPFSITSSPGADHLSLHIRAVGDWTEELYNRFRCFGQTVHHEELLQTCLKTFTPTLDSNTTGVESSGTKTPLASPITLARASQGVLKGVPLVRDSSGFDRKGSVCDNQLAEGIPYHMHLSMNPLWKNNSHESRDYDGGGMEERKMDTTGLGEHRVVIPSKAKNEGPGSAELSGQEVALAQSDPSSLATNDRTPKVQRTTANEATGIMTVANAEKSLYSRPRVAPRQRHHSFLQDLAHVRQSPEVASREVPLKLRLDGPFGAPVQGYRDYSVMLLIGAGIGVTPFASVLSDLVHRMRKISQGSAVPRFQKVYFYWSVHSQSEVLWFSRVLEAISREDLHNILDLNIHITGLRQSSDVRTLPLKLAQVAVHKLTGMDVMSGLNGRVLTRFGRPDWARVFRDLQIRHSKEKKIGVFYSGPNTLASVLKRLSNKYSTHGNKFSFTKEAFGYW